MRLQLQLTPNTQPVPFDHLHELTKALHRWLGPNNDQHDGLSLYSFGWLQGGRKQDDSLQFSRGAQWNISFYDDAASRQLLTGLLKLPPVAFGMRVIGAQELPTPTFGEMFCFKTDGSAVLARKTRADETKAYLFWKDELANEVITGILRQKLEKAGYTGEHLAVQAYFDNNYAKPRTKKSTVKGTEHKGSECPVIVAGTPEAVRFAWLVGIGDLTGSGFGGLR